MLSHISFQINLVVFGMLCVYLETSLGVVSWDDALGQLRIFLE